MEFLNDSFVFDPKRVIYSIRLNKGNYSPCVPDKAWDYSAKAIKDDEWGIHAVRFYSLKEGHCWHFMLMFCTRLVNIHNAVFLLLESSIDDIIMENQEEISLKRANIVAKMNTDDFLEYCSHNNIHLPEGIFCSNPARIR